MRRRGVLLTRTDIPASEPRLRDVSAVFNPGAARFRDTELLLLRVQTRGRETILMWAELTDGVAKVRPAATRIRGLDPEARGIYHVYDPRLTVLEDRLFVMFACDQDDGCRLGLAVADEFGEFELVSLDEGGDRRNGVLFPERIDGRWARLERPNHPRANDLVSSGDHIEIAFSDDGVHWGDRTSLLAGRRRSWDELIGAGPPPLRTETGWLLFYHGVATHAGMGNIYQMGAVVLDAHDPTRIVARTRENLLEPRELYELTGQVPGVVFPTGCIPRSDAPILARSDVLDIYYGAADTCVAAVETSVGEVLDECHPQE